MAWLAHNTYPLAAFLLGLTHSAATVGTGIQQMWTSTRLHHFNLQHCLQGLHPRKMGHSESIPTLGFLGVFVQKVSTSPVSRVWALGFTFRGTLPLQHDVAWLAQHDRVQECDCRSTPFDCLVLGGH